MTQEFEEEVRRDNEKKKLEGNKLGGKGGKEVALQLECDSSDSQQQPSSTWTDRQIAKKANERQRTRTDLYPDIQENFPESSKIQVRDIVGRRGKCSEV